MRTLFMGTPEFAVPCLNTLKEKTDLTGVVTQPDAPRGRGYTLTPPPVKAAANGTAPVYQPHTLKNEAFLDELNALNPDLIVVVAYGKILPGYILDFPKFGCINVHASLLPKYRGAAPIQRAVMNGERESGVTTMMMDAGIDTGDILLMKKIPLAPDETGGSLHDKLSLLGAEVLGDTLDLLISGKLTRTPQQDELSTYAHMIDKKTGLIDWNRPAAEIYNLIRGLNPYPLAYTYTGGKMLKIIKASLCGTNELRPGQTKKTDAGLAAGTGGGGLRIEEVKLEGRGAMSIHEFLKGNTINLTGG